MLMRRTRSRQRVPSAICSHALSVLNFLLISRLLPVAAATAFDFSLLLVLGLVAVTAALAICLYYHAQRAQQLRASESRYRDVFDSAAVGMYELSAEGTFQR